MNEEVGKFNILSECGGCTLMRNFKDEFSVHVEGWGVIRGSGEVAMDISDRGKCMIKCRIFNVIDECHSGFHNHGDEDDEVDSFPVQDGVVRSSDGEVKFTGFLFHDGVSVLGFSVYVLGFSVYGSVQCSGAKISSGVKISGCVGVCECVISGGVSECVSVHLSG